jgi:hydroxymethylpyrimidine/phosphomethylpyrimidine kinase
MARRQKRRSQNAATAVALTIAGSDSSAGAGIQADLKTFSARGVYGLTAVTCIVAETPGKVSCIQLVEPEIVREQIDLVLRSFPVAAMKTGLLCNEAIVSTVAGTLARVKKRKLVVDPVMIATSGDVLLDPQAISVYERELFPLASLIMPNMDEAARLLGDSIADLTQVRRAARALAKKYRVVVLLKGGHLRGKRAVDVLSDGTDLREFSSAFVPNVKTHGTGCTYSAAITAELARGTELHRAIARAKRFVSAAIRSRLVWRTRENEVSALNLIPE